MRLKLGCLEGFAVSWLRCEFKTDVRVVLPLVSLKKVVKDFLLALGFKISFFLTVPMDYDCVVFDCR